MSVRILKSGILTTIQDLGRSGFRRFGVNPTGAMDRTAARLINILLGNEENEAVVEMHFPATEIEFEKDSVFAIGGADFSAKLDGEPVENWRVNFAEKKSVLRFSKKEFGNRAYFAVKGGLRIKQVLGGASTNLAANFSGFDGSTLRKDDRLLFNDKKFRTESRPHKISNSLIPFYRSFPTVRVIVGAEFERLTDSSRETFTEKNFTISKNSDRMGFRLSSDPLQLQKPKEILSSAVSFGTIQILPDGQLIVLMADHPTSGGYPRLGNVISVDLPLLAQLGAKDKVAFHLISIEEAENLALKLEKDLNLLKIAVNFSNAHD